MDGPCSKTCSVGVMKRTRNCSNPEPTCGGNPCFGVDEVEAECLVAECDRKFIACVLYANKPCTDTYLCNIYAANHLQLVENLMQPSLPKDHRLY